MTLDKRTLTVLAVSTLLLAACDLPFLADQEAKIEARREAEGRAVGSACRHAGRAIEECYERSPRVSKAAIFAGWRDMDGYMRENNIQVVSPDVPEPPVKQSESAEEKPKAAAASPAEEKPKAAAASPAEEKPKAVEAPPSGKKAAEVPATIKQGAALPVRGKQLRRFS